MRPDNSHTQNKRLRNYSNNSSFLRCALEGNCFKHTASTRTNEFRTYLLARRSEWHQNRDRQPGHQNWFLKEKEDKTYVHAIAVFFIPQFLKIQPNLAVTIPRYFEILWIAIFFRVSEVKWSKEMYILSLNDEFFNIQ